jgi:hypothetical protein
MIRNNQNNHNDSQQLLDAYVWGKGEDGRLGIGDER